MKAKDMVAALECALMKNLGVKQITVDGQTVSFASLEEMQNALDYWTRRANKEAGRRPLFRGFNLGSGWAGETGVDSSLNSE